MTLQFPRMPEQITKAESRILDYISNNPISRFVRRLGCGDYKELRRLVADQNVSEGPAVKLMQTLHSEEAFTVDNWFLRQQMYLQKTLEGLEQEEFQKAVSALCSAHRVFIHAKSASSSLGQLLMFRLRRLGIQSVLLPSGGSEVLEGLSQAKTGDLVVMFSFSKLSQEGKMILGYRKEALPCICPGRGTGRYPAVRLSGRGKRVSLDDGACGAGGRTGSGGIRTDGRGLRRKPLPSVPYEKNLCAKPVKFQRASGGQSLPVILQLLSEIAAIVNPTAAILFCTDWRLFHMLVKRSVIRCRFS